MKILFAATILLFFACTSYCQHIEVDRWDSVDAKARSRPIQAAWLRGTFTRRRMPYFGSDGDLHYKTTDFLPDTGLVMMGGTWRHFNDPRFFAQGEYETFYHCYDMGICPVKRTYQFLNGRVIDSSAIKPYGINSDPNDTLKPIIKY